MPAVPLSSIWRWFAGCTVAESRNLRLAARVGDIEPFRVMDLLARARTLEAAGRSVVHMEIGEPDFPTPAPVVEAGLRALSDGHTQYTPALGLPALREAIAGHYAEQGVNISPERIVITPGASGALLLALGTVLNPGEGLLLADPGYPCNRHFARFIEGVPQAVPVGPESRYQLTAEQVAAHWQPNSAAVLVASPSNPTGTVLTKGEITELAAAVEARRGCLLVDEIYHGLVYGEAPPSALTVTDRAFIINSFSKYFCMTGWRLGWLVVPEGYVRAVEKLAQNLFIAASTPAQYAALAAFAPETRTILEERRAEFQRRRDYLLPALRELGLEIPIVPQGAFYLYADISRFSNDAEAFSADLLERAGVAVTPGTDFGHHRAERHVRFAYTTAREQLEEGVRRIAEHLNLLSTEPDL